MAECVLDVMQTLETCADWSRVEIAYCRDEIFVSGASLVVAYLAVAFLNEED